ncbi:MAG: sterol desaturase family protein [Flavobacterium sp.]
MEEIKMALLEVPGGILKAIAFNGIIIGSAYCLIWNRYVRRLQHRKIQARSRVDREQLAREVRNAWGTFAIGMLFSTAVLLLSARGLTEIYTDITDHSLVWAALTLPVLLVIDDTWFYWCHRLLHHPRIFRHVHLEHHRSTDVNPFSSLSFHMLEPLLLSAWIFPVALVVPIYAPVLGVVQVLGLLDNVKAHLGYELYPAWWNRSWLRFLTSSTHHNMHHTRFRGNYGVHFRIWDRLMGTEFPRL